MINKSIIEVENIAKYYRIGVNEKANTITEQIINGITYPIRNFNRITQLNKFDNENDPTIFKALHDVNFKVAEGDVLGIIGRNGAGKSTLLKVLSRITEPTNGKIKIRGRVSSLLEVGTGFHPELTGKENVYMNGTILGMTKKEIDSKFDEIVDFSGVEKHIYTPVKFYSSGMKVRLGFSVAAHLEPEILIIDEVLAVGDLGFQQRCLGKMNEVAKGGRTVLFVSHNMASVEGLCSRCLLLENGTITQNSSPYEVIESYRDLTTRQSKINIADRTDREGSGDLRIEKLSINDGLGVKSGDPLKLEVEYNSTKDIKNGHLALTFCRNFDERIFVIDSRVQGVNLNFKKGRGKLVIQLDRLYLLSNAYNINIWLSSGAEVVDYVLNAVSFTVEDTDFYGTGNSLLASKHGYFYTEKSNWRLE